MCPNVCMFCDVHDYALGLSELVHSSTTIQKAVGGQVKSIMQPNKYKHFRALGLHPKSLVKDEMASNAKADGEAGAKVLTPLDMDVIDISWMEHNVADRAPCLSRAAKVGPCLAAASRHPALARTDSRIDTTLGSITAPTRTHSRIDTTLICRHSLPTLSVGRLYVAGHNFFTKNFWMVSDIREIVVTGRRARMRVQRLVHRNANLFSFVAAPPQVG